MQQTELQERKLQQEHESKLNLQPRNEKKKRKGCEISPIERTKKGRRRVLGKDLQIEWKEARVDEIHGLRILKRNPITLQVRTPMPKQDLPNENSFDENEIGKRHGNYE